jgi:hypothetical protein
MKNSLISVSKLISKGLKVEFDKDGYKVNNVHGIVMAKAHREKNVYLFKVNVWKENANVTKFSNEGATLWNQRLGHFNMASFKKLEKMVNNMNWKKLPFTMCVKLALKENVKGHLFLKMKRLGLLNFWSLCIAMCADQ